MSKEKSLSIVYTFTRDDGFGPEIVVLGFNIPETLQGEDSSELFELLDPHMLITWTHPDAETTAWLARVQEAVQNCRNIKCGVGNWHLFPTKIGRETGDSFQTTVYLNSTNQSPMPEPVRSYA